MQQHCRAKNITTTTTISSKVTTAHQKKTINRPGKKQVVKQHQVQSVKHE